MTWPGSARSSTSHSATPAWAAPRFPTAPMQVGSQHALAHTEPLGRRLHRPGVQPGDDRVVDVALGQPGVLQRGGERLAGERDVELLAEALLPDVRIGLAGHTPAVEELVARGAPADQLRHGVRRARTRRRPRRRRCRAPPPNRPARCAGPRPRPASCGPPPIPSPGGDQRLQQRADGRARGPGEVVGAAPLARARAPRAPSSRSSCRDTAGPAWRGTGPAPHRPPVPPPGRGDRPRPPASSCPRRRRRRRACPARRRCPAPSRWRHAGVASRAGTCPRPRCRCSSLPHLQIDVHGPPSGSLARRVRRRSTCRTRCPLPLWPGRSPRTTSRQPCASH